MSSSSRCAGPEAPARRAALLAVAAAICLPAVATQSAARSAMPSPSELRVDLPGARLHGQARLRFLGLHMYDIRLWTASPLAGDDPLRVPAALEIEYARQFKGLSIAERSLTEMQRVGDFNAADGERWLARMQQLFPDVQAGDRITGIHRPDESARFYFNGRFVGEVRDGAFARLFFGVWLSPRTSEPQLRAALLGSAP